MTKKNDKITEIQHIVKPSSKNRLKFEGKIVKEYCGLQHDFRVSRVQNTYNEDAVLCCKELLNIDESTAKGLLGGSFENVDLDKEALTLEFNYCSPSKKS